MYTKYEEMKVIQNLLTNYAQNNKRGYESAARDLQQKSSQLAPNIENGKTQISSLSSSLQMMAGYQEDYSKAMSVLAELKKPVNLYEMAVSEYETEESLKQRQFEANGLFYTLRTQNADYKSVMDDISYSMIVQHDKNLEDLATIGLDAKVEQLEEAFSNGQISKEQLIVYTNACYSLSTNPDFLEWAQDFEQEKSTGRTM